MEFVSIGFLWKKNVPDYNNSCLSDSGFVSWQVMRFNKYFWLLGADGPKVFEKPEIRQEAQPSCWCGGGRGGDIETLLSSFKAELSYFRSIKMHQLLTHDDCFHLCSSLHQTGFLFGMWQTFHVSITKRLKLHVPAVWVLLLFWFCF